MKYPHLNTLFDLRNRGLVTVRPHPTLPLTIWNYTAAAMAIPPHDWLPAMMDARGLILDFSGEVVGRGFRKFWNVDQVRKLIPVGKPEIFEKLDGSLILLCMYEGNQLVSSRGSFTSDQANWAASYITKHYPRLNTEKLTYVWEAIYPANRVVVDYKGVSALKLLACIRPDGMDDNDEFLRCQALGVPTAKKFDWNSIAETQFIADRQVGTEWEGYVLRWPNGFRAKIKGADYIRLHRTLTHTSTKTIWAMLAAGESLSPLGAGTSREFQIWVMQQQDKFQNALRDIHDKYHMIMMNLTKSQYPDRKVFAEFAKTQEHPALMFAMFDQKDPRPVIWKLLKPQRAEFFSEEIRSETPDA